MGLFSAFVIEIVVIMQFRFEMHINITVTAFDEHTCLVDPRSLVRLMAA